MDTTINLEPTASLSRSCAALDDPLTRFEAQFSTTIDSKEVPVGTLNGWFLSATTLGEFADWSFAAGPDAEIIGVAAAEIIDDSMACMLPISNVMLIDRMYLEPAFRGGQLVRGMAEAFAALVGLNRRGCVATTFPAPRAADGSDYAAERADRAREALTMSLERQGFDRWRESGVCWTVLSAAGPH